MVGERGVTAVPVDHPSRKLSKSWPVVFLKWPLGGPAGCGACYGRGYFATDDGDMMCDCTAAQMRCKEEAP